MRKFLDGSLVFCLGIFLTSASVRGDDETPERGRRETAAKKDIESLQGVWTAVSLKALGKQLPEKGVKKLAISLTITGAKATIKMRMEGTTPRALTLDLDPTKTPKAIDLKFAGDKDQ